MFFIIPQLLFLKTIVSGWIIKQTLAQNLSEWAEKAYNKAH